MGFILLLFLLGVGSAASDASEAVPSRPYWTGRIEQDTTWRDTVYVGGDVTIAAAATLTLAPNTQVLFLPYYDATQGGLDSTRAELIVEGRLAAQAGGIVFRSADAGSLGADWHGLVVERGGRADVSYAAIRDGLRCLYAKRGGRVTMDAIAFANCGKPTAPADAAKLATPEERARKEDFPKIGGQETTSTTRRIISKLIMGGLSHSAAARDSTQVDSGVSRVAGKLLVGTLVGSAVLVGGASTGSERAAGAAFRVGYPVGVGLGTSLLDRHDYPRSLAYSIGGSLLGVGIGAALVHRYRISHPLRIITVYLIVQPITATLASELFRKPPESDRFSVGLVPDARGNWSARATLRF